MKTLLLTLILLAIANACQKAQHRAPPSPPDASASLPPAEVPTEEQTDALAPVETSALLARFVPEFGTIYFAFDSDEIDDESRELLDAVADHLNAYPLVRVRIEGHTDESGSLEYNLELGERRADAIANYLIDLGVDQAQLQTVSHGEKNPAFFGTQPEAWAMNRRGELVVEDPTVLGQAKVSPSNLEDENPLN